jgi:hypothetical protein
VTVSIGRVVASQRWVPMKQSLFSMTLAGDICAGIEATTSSRGEEEEVEERTGLIRYQGVRSYAWVLEEEEEDVLWSPAK